MDFGLGTSFLRELCGVGDVLSPLMESFGVTSTDISCLTSTEGDFDGVEVGDDSFFFSLAEAPFESAFLALVNSSSLPSYIACNLNKIGPSTDLPDNHSSAVNAGLLEGASG